MVKYDNLSKMTVYRLTSKATANFIGSDESRDISYFDLEENEIIMIIGKFLWKKYDIYHRFVAVSLSTGNVFKCIDSWLDYQDKII